MSYLWWTASGRSRIIGLSCSCISMNKSHFHGSIFGVQIYWHLLVSFPWRLYSPTPSSWFIKLWNFYIVYKLMFRFVLREQLIRSQWYLVCSCISIGTSHFHGDCFAMYFRSWFIDFEYLSWFFSFPFLTLVCLNQMLWNLYTMPIIKKIRTSPNLGNTTYSSWDMSLYYILHGHIPHLFYFVSRLCIYVLDHFSHTDFFLRFRLLLWWWLQYI